MGMMDLFGMMQKAKTLQTRMTEMQKELAMQIFSGTDSSGKVTVRMTGATLFVSCEIASGFESAGPAAVGSAVVEASNNAMSSFRTASMERLTAIKKELGLPDNFELPF